MQLFSIESDGKINLDMKASNKGAQCGQANPFLPSA